MKKLNFTYAWMILCLLCLTFTSCDDAKNKIIGDAVYLVESENGVTNLQISDEYGATASVTVKKTSPALEDTHVTLTVSEEAVVEFNKQNDTNYDILPKGFYEVLNDDVVIKTGAATSEKVNIKILPLSDDLKNSGKKFVLPISVASTSDPNLKILQTSKSAFYGCQFVIVTKAIEVPKEVQIKPTMRQDYELSDWTLELRVKSSIVGSGYNNQAFANIGATQGVANGYIYARFEGNSINIAINGKGVSPKFNGDGPKSNTWYHIALVYRQSTATVQTYLNGALNNEVKASQFERPCIFGAESFTFALKNKFDRFAMHEVRFWTKAISAQQIRNNIFSVDPQSDGLEAYWKMNEGEGRTLYDATEHGNNAELIANSESYFSRVKWLTVRSDEK